MNNIALQTNNLSKTYQMGENKVEALKKVTIEIETGSFVALTGTSGSGKSTLMHLLGALDVPTEGEVFIHDTNLSKCSEKQLAKVRRDEIGFVFQNFCLIQELNVKENIVLPILLASGKVNEEYIGELMEQLGIADRAKHMPSQLSGGQQQRVAIARALANDPSILLCDEPTGNLDQKTSDEVMKLLHYMHKKYNKTCLVVTHDVHVASGADYILTIEDGCITQRT